MGRGGLWGAGHRVGKREGESVGKGGAEEKGFRGEG